MRFPPERQPWYECVCCPANIARSIASLGHYAFSQSEDALFVNLFADSTLDTELKAKPLRFDVKTNYPWKETVRIVIMHTKPVSFTLALRIPRWCRTPELKVNGKKIDMPQHVSKGYARIKETWKKGDTIELTLPMPVNRVHAHPRVRAASGRVALMRGPLVYCIEEIDNGKNLDDIALPPASKLQAQFKRDLLGGVVTITGQAIRLSENSWTGTLYKTDHKGGESFSLRAVPYFTWCNRRPGQMLVWIRE